MHCNTVQMKLQDVLLQDRLKLRVCCVEDCACVSMKRGVNASWEEAYACNWNPDIICMPSSPT